MTVTRTEVADVVAWAKDYDGPLFHSLGPCDPPYHLTTITKRFGKPGSAPAKEGTDGLFARASRGFMGQVWDGGDIAFQPETWAAFLPHLHPGAFGMAFASSRGWHRLACAIEDAGFIIHPSIFLWTYGQGFPKATRIDTKGGGEAWSGHRYGLQALKPAAEPIIVFQKPYEGRPVDDITRTGAGALNVDGGRIAGEVPETTQGASSNIYGGGAGLFPGGKQASKPSSAGRWPANFALVHHPDCGEQCVEGCPVRLLPQSGGGAYPKKVIGASPIAFRGDEEREQRIELDDSGSASRFFHSGDWQAEALEQADPVLYAAKASVAEREAGLHLDGSDGRRCTHPTVKPIALARWLATLLLPPEQYAPRRILIPFSGVASEMIGAGLAGWEEVQGVELSKEYAEIGAIRLEWWLGRGWQMPLFGG